MSSFLSLFIGISFVLRWDCFPRDNTARKEPDDDDDDDRARKERLRSAFLSQHRACDHVRRRTFSISQYRFDRYPI